MVNKIDLAIVYYEKEIDLLKLLVRSIELYCDKNIVDKIFFLNNSANEKFGHEEFDKHVMPIFSIFKQSIEIINASEFGIYHASESDTDVAQQALKFEVSNITNKDYYLVLNAKDHFIKSLTYERLFGPNGQPQTHLQIHGEYLKTCLSESCQYLNVDLDVSKPVLPTVTPYLMITQLVRELNTFILKNDNLSIYELIKKNNKMTEFLLYCAFVYFKGGFEQWYYIGEKPYATLFTKWPESEEDIERVLKSTSRSEVYTFSVHNKRFVQLSEEHINYISTLWKNAQLFNSIEEGKSFIKKQAKVDNITINPVSNPNNDGKVTEGRNGRLFIANDSNQVINQHLGKKILSKEQIISWKKILEFRKAYCTSLGVHYFALIIPDAHAVYKEDLPVLDNVDSNRPIKQILSNLYDLSYVSYPLDDMNKSKSHGEVYHPSDSHYSGFGAFICYRSLLKQMKLNIKLLSDSEVNIFDKSGSGDLGDKFSPPKTASFTECVVKNPSATKVWNNEVTNRGHMSLWLNTDKKKPKCLLLTDSYGWKIQRFFAESFSELFIVHSPLLETEAIEKFKPDIVITLMAERFLIYTPKDIFDQSAMSFAIEKGSKITSYDKIYKLKKDLEVS